ncbi:MAG TPA: hypothetical protein VIY48_12700 [Candidatus Paceibacterota bacterium]
MGKAPSSRAAGVTMLTGSETTVFSALVAPSQLDPCTIVGSANVTPGTGTTGITVRCKNQVGTPIGTAQQVTVIAGSPISFSWAFLDVTQVNTSYQITMTQTGTPSANGTVNEAVSYAIADG